MQIAMWGLRGGAGTTSLTAMLGDALCQLGESVLLVDLNPTDLLRRQFATPYSDRYGWAWGSKNGISWHQHAYGVKDGLSILPFGRPGGLRPISPPHFPGSDIFWMKAAASLRAQYPWVIFDMPAGGQDYMRLRALSKLDIMVVRVDPASHVLLSRSELNGNTRILANDYAPKQPTNDDILLQWQTIYQRQLLPVTAHDMLTLAAWCITQRPRPPSA